MRTTTSRNAAEMHMPTSAETISDNSETDALAPLNCTAVLTHHWLVKRRGGERVLEALCELLPGSPIYTLVYDRGGAGEGWPEVHTSLLQRIPGARRHYPKLLPLMPLAARRVKLPPVDLVMCSDAALAKAMTPAPRSKVVCYCHSPMRYAFDAAVAGEYRKQFGMPARAAWDVVTAMVRRADLKAAGRVDQFVANSHHVAERIQRYYGRDSIVVHPPVDLPPAPATGAREDFYLCVGQHVPYKRLDLAIEACRKLGRKLVVIGEGPDVDRYQKTRPPHVDWLGWLAGDAVLKHYHRARALLFPGEEDFGIVPVEAMAHGCPVIAYGVGGATESVVDGRTGVWFAEQTVDSVVDAIERFETLTFNSAAMHAHCQRFSRARFLREMHGVLEGVLNCG